MTLIAKRMADIKPSPTLSLAQKAQELQRMGKDIINLAVGEPDFPTPQWICEAAIDAIHHQQTKYTAVGGTPELKQAIVQKFSRENNLKYDVREVMASTGGKQAIFNALLATLNPGDEVVIPAPYWVSYLDMVRIAEGNLVTIPCSQAQSFKLKPEQLEAAITSKTRWLLFNAPSNPVGVMYSYDELWQLAQVLLRHPQVMVMSDDIYEHIIFGQTPFNALADVELQLKERTLVVNGVSKSYAMTGWRIGYAAGPADLITAMTDLQSQSTSNPCAIAQAAAVTALNGPQDFLKGWCQEFSQRCDLVIDRLNGIPGLQCLKPEGAFYAFPDCLSLLGRKTKEGKHINNDVDLCVYLLEEAGVTVVPGSPFGGAGHLRLSFALDKATLQRALDRIEQAIRDLQP